MGCFYTQSSCTTTAIFSSLLLGTLPLAGGLLPAQPARSQSITAAADGTGTTLVINGNQIDIGGGFSNDGGNLFHSFQQFGLKSSEIANFLAHPQLQNILGRVTGGNASIIDGLIQVTGGNPNLYLMNPAGIVFGPNASLNLPAAFTATTADRIGFGNGHWFNALGSNDFNTLVGPPNQFAFTAHQPGSIVNAGDLAVATGENLMLLGGSVVNTGSLSAPGGNITIAAVPGKHRLHISQDGMVLNLEIETTADPASAPPLPPPLSLPALLTAANVDHATGVTVNMEGGLQLTGSTFPLPTTPGSAIVSGTLDAAATAANQLGGHATVLGHRIVAIDIQIETAGTTAAGTAGDVIFRAAGDITLASSNDTPLTFQPGQGIIRVQADADGDDAGSVFANGIDLMAPGRDLTISGDSIQVGAIDTSVNANAAGHGTEAGNILLQSSIGDILTGDLDASVSNGGKGGDITLKSATGHIDTGNLATSTLGGGKGGDITLESSDGNIDTGDLTTAVISGDGDSGNITLGSLTGNITTADITSRAFRQGKGGDVMLQGADISAGTIETLAGTEDNWSVAGTGGNISISATGDIVAGGLDSRTPGGNDAGAIHLQTAGGSITTSDIFSNSSLAQGGAIQLSVAGGPGNIITGKLQSFLSDGIGGDITLNTETGAIQVGDVWTGLPNGGPPGEAGNIALTTQGGDIRAGDVIARSHGGNGGTIDLQVQSGSGQIQVQTVNSASHDAQGGHIHLATADGRITTTGDLAAGSNGAAPAGSIVISTQGAAAHVRLGSIAAGAGKGGTAGDITVETGGGNIVANDLNTSSGGNDSGAISLTAGGPGTITVGDIASDSHGGKAGDVALRVQGGQIETGNIFSISRQHQGANVTAIVEQGNGGIDVGDIDAWSAQGNASAVDLRTQSGSIRAGAISTASVRQNGGDVTAIVEQGSGGIDVEDIDTGSAQGNAGGVDLRTQSGSIRVGAIAAASVIQNGADVTVTVGQGSGGIDVGAIDTSGRTTNGKTGGQVALAAPGAIVTGGIDTSAQIAGDITVNSGDTIDASAGTLFAMGSHHGGTIDLEAENNIDTANINFLLSGFNGDSGDIRIRSRTGNVNTSHGVLAAPSARGQGGDISLAAPIGTVTAGQVNAVSRRQSGGALTFAASGGITLTGGAIETNDNGIRFSNPVTLTGDVAAISHRTGNIEIRAPIDGSHHLTLDAGTGTVQLDGTVGAAVPLASLTVRGLLATAQAEGIAATAIGNITTADIGAAGGIDLTSQQGHLWTGALDTAAIGLAGDIHLSAQGDIAVGSLNAQSQTDRGGNIVATAGRFFRATETFIDQNGIEASLSTAGGIEGGTAIVRHGGGGIVPFKIGDAATNGTAGAISRGHGAAEQTLVTGQQYLHTHKQDLDRIQIISVPPGSPPSSMAVPSAAGPLLPQPAPESGNAPGASAALPSRNDPLKSTALLIGDLLGVNTQIDPDPAGHYAVQWEVPGNPLELEVPIPQQPLLNERWQANRAPRSQFVHLNRLALDFSALNFNFSKSLAPLGVEEAVTFIDQLFEAEFEQHAGENLTDKTITPENLRETLKGIEAQTGQRAVIIYALALPEHLQLILVLPEGPPRVKRVAAAKSKVLNRKLQQFRQTLHDVEGEDYLPSAQQLYDWLIRPLEADLERLEIDTLIFAMDAGLRLLPLAALHDGERFLVERYSLGTVPSVSLTDTRYQSIKQMPALAMGASEFPYSHHVPLPNVPLELRAVAQEVWQGEAFLNGQFTLKALRQRRQQQPFGVVHLATHAAFSVPSGQRPYLQFWDRPVTLDGLRTAQWYGSPGVELLVLSACETAVGNADNELGFAGLAVRAGVKSALASLWKVSDAGTLVLMTAFYHHLGEEKVKIKTEALRRAQLAMLQGQTRLENGQLVGTWGAVPLPPHLAREGVQQLSHPYYWSGFAMIGSPW